MAREAFRALIQLQFLFDLRPRDARFLAVGAFGAFNRAGILDVLDRAAHLPHQGFGLGELFVQLRPVAGRFGGQGAVTHKCLFGRRHHTPRGKRLPIQIARGNCRRAGGICF